jgi:hypothetical protein
MPTSFAITTFFVIVSLNNAGQLAPVDKSELPAPYNIGPIHFSEGSCLMVRGKMEHPEKYLCQVFTSPAETKLTYQASGFVMPVEASPPPAPPPPERKSEAEPSKKDDIQVEAPKPKKVAQQPRQTKTAMFDGNPLTSLFSW